MGSLCTIDISVPNVPHLSVLGHCLGLGLVSGSQLNESQVTAPGFPDLPAATPHFVAHPLGSACFQLPIKMGMKEKDRECMYWLIGVVVCDGCL